ncbi:hypothetical protein HZS80_11990 [Halomonas glaciei]|uniref:DNA-binding protein n=1 Tax=Vreelandella glaciei TaxID=186761 RepID=A0A7Z0LU16_9GAMM|nr:hypothetical protein [Halomonas glaciei]NYS78418.1 hypothetical protein [Halomonas glaciei]
MFNFLKGDKSMVTATKIGASDTATKIGTSDTATANDIVKVSPEELVKRMVASNPNVMGKMPERRLKSIVRGTLVALAQEVNECQEGRLQVPGLGRITIRQTEVEKDGSPATVKRVMLNPAKPKPKV